MFGDAPLNSPQDLHLVAEIDKRVFADRAEYMGDPEVVDVPVKPLIDPAYLDRRAADIDPRKPLAPAAVKPRVEEPQTTHFSIVDRWGNAVSNNYTLNVWFGAGVVVKGTDYLLDDEIDNSWVKPGAPNQFGVVEGDASAIAPGKCPLSSMTPTICMKDGQGAVVLRTPGGSRFFTALFPVLANVYAHGPPLNQAVAAQRFHDHFLPGNTIFFEPYAPPSEAMKPALTARGYRLETQDYNGDIEAIQIRDDAPIAVAGPRAGGVARIVRRSPTERFVRPARRLR